MIVHIVMFQFKYENKEANIAKTKEMLEALIKKIEPLKHMEIGINFNQGERAFDMSLYSTFDDNEGLGIYALHPAHMEVVAFLKEVVFTSKVVDYVV